MIDLHTPEFGEEVEAAHPCPSALRLLARRRSTKAKDMGAPGPSPDQLRQLLTVAARVPDHGKLTPWRFIVFAGAARAAFGDVLAARFRETQKEAPAPRVEFERDRFARAPVVVAVVSRVTENHKIPEWEQTMSAGAVCQNMLIGASAMGFAAQWITEWCAYDRTVKDALGLKSGERVAGFVYLGTAQCAPTERARPSLDDLITEWESNNQ